MSGLNKIEAEKIVSNLNKDERMDLLMYLAEEEEIIAVRDGEDITYFLSSGDDK